MTDNITFRRPVLIRTHGEGITCDGSCRNHGVPTSRASETSCITRYATPGPTRIVPSSSMMRSSQYPPHSMGIGF